MASDCAKSWLCFGQQFLNLFILPQCGRIVAARVLIVMWITDLFIAATPIRRGKRAPPYYRRRCAGTNAAAQIL